MLLKNKDIREGGAESLCYQALRQLKIDIFLKANSFRQWQRYGH